MNKKLKKAVIPYRFPAFARSVLALAMVAAACGDPGADDDGGAPDAAVPAEMNCSDGVDDDGDTRADCDDSDCMDDPACLPVEVCDDDIDNDGDSFTDCADDECVGDAACIGPEVCDDNIDNDADGDTDCADDDCMSESICISDEECDDGVDNDGDGAVDCADIEDCEDAVACGGEICDDNFDNDGDGAVDCEDPDCGLQPACPASCAAPVSIADPSVTMADNTGQPDINMGTCQMTGGPDLVFAVEPTHGDILEIKVESDVDLGIYVLDICTGGGDELGCADSYAGPAAVEKLVLRDVVPGDPLYVFVGGFRDGETGPFTLDVASRAIVCGDGMVDGDEDCDDGNTTAGDGCDDSCAFEYVCGNSVLEPGEQCDDGNTANGDGCTMDCQHESCGNGTVDPLEQCDDGNTTSGDGCSEDCTFESICGDGFPEEGEQCDDGNTLNGDGCDQFCQIESDCGNGTIELPVENCDDGNMVAGDGCDATCQVESEPELEPNDDGMIDIFALGIAGNDFDAANANGPFSADTIIEAALDPVGDEDVFAIVNNDVVAVSVRFDTHDATLGFGVPCEGTIDTGLNIRDAAGTELDSVDNRDPTMDDCSGLDYVIPAGETVYAHVTAFADISVIPSYFLSIDFN